MHNVLVVPSLQAFRCTLSILTVTCVWSVCDDGHGRTAANAVCRLVDVVVLRTTSHLILTTSTLHKPVRQSCSCNAMNRCPDTFVQHSVDSHQLQLQLQTAMSVSEMTASEKKWRRARHNGSTVWMCSLLFALQIWSFFCKWHIRSITFALALCWPHVCVGVSHVGMRSLLHLAICPAFASLFFVAHSPHASHSFVPSPAHRTLHCYAITFMFARVIYFVTMTIDSCSCARRLASLYSQRICAWHATIWSYEFEPM